MSSEWTTIGAIAQVFDGPHATPKKIDSGPYFLSISSLDKGKLDLSKSAHLSEAEFEKWTRRVTPQPGDVLFSYETRLGEAALMPEGVRACLGRRMGLLRPNRDLVLPDYLLYAYLSPDFQETIKSRTVHGCTVDRIALKDLPSFPIRIPSLTEQHRAVNALKSVDDKIQANHRINQILEQMAQAIFKSWFVDFEPVRAKIAARERWQATQPGNEAASPVCYAGELGDPAAGEDLETAMNLAAMQAISGKNREELARLQREQPEQYAELCATAELFPSAMQDSELGEIPQGWKVGRLADLLVFNPRRSLKKGVLAPYLDMKNVPTSGHLAEEVVEREMGSGTKFINGDTLLARITPCLENGKTAFVDFLDDGQVGWGSTEYIVIRPKDDYPESLGYFIARDTSFRQHAIQSMTGTSGRQRANAKALGDLPWLIYPEKLVKMFAKLAGSYLKLARRHGDESKSLGSIRDTLLPRLLSGELTMPEPEGQLAEATNG